MHIFHQALQVSILDVVRRYTMVKRYKRNLVMPVLQFDGLSELVIDPESNTFYCDHGEYHGNVIDFVRIIRDTTQVKAAEWLVEEFMEKEEPCLSAKRILV